MSEEQKNEIVTVDYIETLVYTIRGQQVMLDQDLAALYGYEVKRLNEQVKRNIERSPDDFMFQLTREEAEIVKSQFATSPKSDFFAGQEGGRRKLPFVFTEQGVNMLSAVLKSDIAIEQSIAIVRAFREMRHYIRQFDVAVIGPDIKGYRFFGYSHFLYSNFTRLEIGEGYDASSIQYFTCFSLMLMLLPVM